MELTKDWLLGRHTDGNREESHRPQMPGKQMLFREGESKETQPHGELRAQGSVAWDPKRSFKSPDILPIVAQ